MRIKKILLLTLLIGTSYLVSSQELFQKHIIGQGDELLAKSVLTQDNGHLVFYESTTNSFGNTDMALMKIDKLGNVEWNKHFGENKREIVRHIIPFENSFLISGWVNQFALTDDYYLAILDTDGNIIKEKYWGDYDDDEIQWVEYLQDGNFACAGNTRSNRILGLSELSYAKLDQNLNLGTIHVYSTSGDDVARKIIESPNTDLFIAGFTSNNDKQALTMRIDAEGNLKWSKKITQSSNYWDMEMLDNNDLLCAGELLNTGNDALVTKIDSMGNLLWAKTYPFQGKSTIFKIKKAHNNNFILIGEAETGSKGTMDIFFIEIDGNGNFIGGYTYGGTENENYPSISYSTADSGYFITAHTLSYGAQSSDLLLINTDDSGNSCCATPIENMTVENHELNLQNINFATGSFPFYETDHNVNTADLGLDEELLCYSPVDILGRDTIPCGESNNEKYSADIDFLLDLIWTVPPTATIINNINDTTIYIDFANESGTIFLLSSCGDTLDSLFVFVEKEINFSLGNDTLLCHGNSFYLTPGTGFNSYLWQDGSTESTFLVSESGEYWVRVENSCGIASDTIKIEFNQPLDIDLGNDTSFCYGQSVLLSPGGEYYSYFWQDGSTDSILQAGLTGYYWVIVTDSVGCSATDSIYIEANMEFGFSLGPDTSIICDGDYIFLHGPQGYESYLWQDGSNYLDFLADTAGFYWLEVTDTNSCAARDSMLLIVNKIPDDFLGNDTVMCEGEYFDIHAPSYYHKYLWQDGSTDSVFIAWQTGKYWVYVEDSIGCSGVDSITISEFQPPVLNHSNDTLICLGDSILLSPGGGMDYYLWNTGSTDSSILVNQEGDYWVEMGTICGLFSDSVLVGFYSNPDFYLGPDTNICSGETIYLSAGQGFYSYLWNDGSTDSILIVKEQGNYFVDVFDGRCSLSDTVKIEECSILWVPNVFTPNNDGYNDEFFAVADNIDEFKMVIFNRWGQVLKTLYSIDETWDGTFRGNQCPEAVYYWKAEFVEINRESLKVKKVMQGSVTIIRGKK